jgi:hypothetical protein
LNEIAFENIFLFEVLGYAFGCALAAEGFLNGFAEPGVDFRAVLGGTLKSGEVRYACFLVVRSGPYGLSSMASMIWDRIAIPEWSGGTDECPPAVSNVTLTS